MVRVWHFDDDRLDFRNVGGDWHAVIEEARIFKAAVLVVNIFLVQRPTDALHYAAVDLPFAITRVYRSAHVLRCHVAKYFGIARFRIDLDITKLRGEAR